MIHFTIKKVLKEKAFKIFTAFLMISFYLNLCFFWLCSMGDDKFIGGLVFFYFLRSWSCFKRTPCGS